MQASGVRVRRVEPAPGTHEPPTADQMAKITRMATARGLEIPRFDTRVEAQRWLDVRNMFARPDDNPGGYSENARAGRCGALSRWGSFSQRTRSS